MERALRVIQEARTAEDAEVISLRLGGLNVSEPSQLQSWALPCWGCVGCIHGEGQSKVSDGIAVAHPAFCLWLWTHRSPADVW